MTQKIPIQEMVKMAGSLRTCGSDIGEPLMAISKREMVMDEKIYVAVTGRDVESKSSLVWAIQNSGGREFCIVYVHQPIHISAPGAMFHEQKLRLYRKEKEKAHKNLDKYLHICRQMQACQCREDIYRKGFGRGREATRRDNLYLECASSNSLSQSEITKGTESVPCSSMVKVDDRIKLAVMEAEISKREARFEISKRVEAEKSAADAMKRAKQSENALRKALEELEKMRSESETRIAQSNMVIKKLQYKCSLSTEALRGLREEQEELKIRLREVSKLKSGRKNHEPPQYFICPITQDVMEDPHVAADGFTYEGEAISGWFERGHETSPMTNKRLSHTSLVPNLALRSAIQEWLQASST
ncbi:unnamed protein product [Thlaspi arvense]|uniref:RING-type E3 ubiquitin transferase n=1 Tax=Thlaspi arvense TaxID=13288 RepID=A0AAU9SDA4_THLAR|nr:unnamed protein product [Thlaspi arvense]